MKDERIQWIDAIRGGGVFIVLITHASNIYFPFLEYFRSGFMAMFFVSAGYTLSIEKTHNFINRKCRRLLIPYFFWGTLGIIVNIFYTKGFLASYRDYTTAFAGVLYSRYCFWPLGVEPNHYFLCNINSPLWFLTAIFLSYVHAWFFFSTNSIKLKGLLLILYLGMTVVFYKCPFLLPWSLDTSYVGALLIISGKYIKDSIYFKFTGIQDFVCIFTLLFIYCFIVKFNGNNNLSVRIYGQHRILSIFLFLIIGVMATLLYGSFFRLVDKTIITKSFAYLGKISMTIMCCHLFAFWLVYIFFGHNLDKQTLSIVKVVFALILSIFISTINQFIKEHYRHSAK